MFGGFLFLFLFFFFILSVPFYFIYWRYGRHFWPRNKYIYAQ